MRIFVRMEWRKRNPGRPADSLQMQGTQQMLLGRGAMLGFTQTRFWLQPGKDLVQGLAHLRQSTEEHLVMGAADLDDLELRRDRTPAEGRIVEIAPALGGTKDHDPPVIVLRPER